MIQSRVFPVHLITIPNLEGSFRISPLGAVSSGHIISRATHDVGLIGCKEYDNRRDRFWLSSAARNRVINPQHYDCSDNGHDDAADINTGYAWAT
jgi:hypothetical protein